jgi:hypothetical protein
VIGVQVMSEVTAEGSDIYSQRRAVRQLYVLNAQVRQGDSGGPVVDLDGRELGVVFAASTASDTTGYALTGGELRAALAAAGVAPGTGWGRRLRDLKARVGQQRCWMWPGRDADLRPRMVPGAPLLVVGWKVASPEDRATNPA